MALPAHLHLDRTCVLHAVKSCNQADQAVLVPNGRRPLFQYLLYNPPAKQSSRYSIPRFHHRPLKSQNVLHAGHDESTTHKHTCLARAPQNVKKDSPFPSLLHYFRINGLFTPSTRKSNFSQVCNLSVAMTSHLAVDDFNTNSAVEEPKPLNLSASPSISQLKHYSSTIRS